MENELNVNKHQRNIFLYTSSGNKRHLSPVRLFFSSLRSEVFSARRWSRRWWDRLIWYHQLRDFFWRLWKEASRGLKVFLNNVEHWLSLTTATVDLESRGQEDIHRLLVLRRAGLHNVHHWGAQRAHGLGDAHSPKNIKTSVQFLQFSLCFGKKANTEAKSDWKKITFHS